VLGDFVPFEPVALPVLAAGGVLSAFVVAALLSLVADPEFPDVLDVGADLAAAEGGEPCGRWSFRR
jgi:hypothetical protein